MALVGLLFGVAIKGSAAAPPLGALLYVFAGTGARPPDVDLRAHPRSRRIIATAIVTTVPAINFSGYLYPAADARGRRRA